MAETKDETFIEKEPSASLSKRTSPSWWIWAHQGDDQDRAIDL